MITIKNNNLFIHGKVKEVIQEMNELYELYGNITIEELIIKLQEKWK